PLANNWMPADSTSRAAFCIPFPRKPRSPPAIICRLIVLFICRQREKAFARRELVPPRSKMLFRESFYHHEACFQLAFWQKLLWSRTNEVSIERKYELRLARNRRSFCQAAAPLCLSEPSLSEG